MRCSDSSEKRHFGKGDCAKSICLFFINYLIMLLLVLFCLWMGTIEKKQSIGDYLIQNRYQMIYLSATVFMLFLMVYFYYLFEDRSILASSKEIWLIFILLDLSMLVCYMFGYMFNVYSRPIAMLALLVLMLFSRRDAVFLNIIFALLLYSIDSFSGVLNESQYATALGSTPLLVFTSGMVAIFVGSKIKTRMQSILTGFAASVPIVIMIACLEFDRGFNVLYLLLYGVESGILSFVFFTALLPIFEGLFNRITDFRLRELTDHDAPLMNELKSKAVGTFNHSIIVAHLAEACAIALGEDAALARAAAYYHDVGKLRQPEYFTENQMGYNPHDELSPELSADIIRSHAKDGYQLILNKHLPKILADVAVQHHGTLPIKYFYAKALKLTDGELNIDDYSYTGPKPQTKIAAIIMIADASEAIARTLPDRSPERVESAVRDIIEERMDLDQFDECNLTMKDLTSIKEAIVSCLTGVYHSRVKYPKLKLKRKGESTESDE